MVLGAHDIDCYVGGMEVHVLEILGNHPNYVRDAAVFKRTKSNVRVVSSRDDQRKCITRESSVIATMNGILSGGPAMTYILETRDDPANKICLIGYQIEGTPDRELVEYGQCELNSGVVPVAACIGVHDFSTRADHHGLLSFLDDYRGAPMLANHGDRCAVLVRELSADGYEAMAPEIGAAVGV